MKDFMYFCKDENYIKVRYGKIEKVMLLFLLISLYIQIMYYWKKYETIRQII